MKKFNWIYLITFVILIAGSLTFNSFVNSPENTDLSATYHPNKEFNDYWYQNSAELTRFELKQARYGEIHEGEAVMIFVTEHLSPIEHIKSYNKDGQDIPILKLNFMKNFNTGLYPYSIMNSVFSPVDINANPYSLRNTFTAQEWCGHVFSMIDLGSKTLTVSTHSYFPGEGDRKTEILLAPQEDEVWNKIRIDHKSLELGDIMIIPSIQHLRFAHKPVKPYKAVATKKQEGDLFRYTVDYKDLGRKFTVWFSAIHPYNIQKWEEELISGSGTSRKVLKTEAKAASSTMLPYWNKNSNADSYLRKELGFE